MELELKVYLAVAGWDYEGEEVLGVFTDIDGAKDAIDNNTGHHDFVEIQVFALNGGRLHDDPEELFRRV